MTKTINTSEERRSAPRERDAEIRKLRVELETCHEVVEAAIAWVDACEHRSSYHRTLAERRLRASVYALPKEET